MQEGRTALMNAARTGRYKIAKLLLKHGANKDHQDKVRGHSRTGGRAVNCKCRDPGVSATPKFCVYINLGPLASNLGSLKIRFCFWKADWHWSLWSRSVEGFADRDRVMVNGAFYWIWECLSASRFQWMVSVRLSVDRNFGIYLSKSEGIFPKIGGRFYPRLCFDVTNVSYVSSRTRTPTISHCITISMVQQRFPAQQLLVGAPIKQVRFRNLFTAH